MAADSATETEADRVADVARSVDGVVDLSGGPLGAAATYLAGRRVVGVRVSDDHLEVHLVVTLERPVRDVAADVRRALQEAFGGRTIDVIVEDVSTATAKDDDEPAASGARPDAGAAQPPAVEGDSPP